MKGWKGQCNSSKKTHNFNRIVSACRRLMIGSLCTARTGGRADEVPDPGGGRAGVCGRTTGRGVSATGADLQALREASVEQRRRFDFSAHRTLFSLSSNLETA